MQRDREVIGFLAMFPAGDGHYRHARFQCAEILQRLEPISLGHEKVRDQHVGGSFFVRPHGALPVCNGFHFVTFNLQRNTQDGPQVFVVVGHQNASHRGRLDKGVQMLFVPAKTSLIQLNRRGRSPAQLLVA